MNFINVLIIIIINFISFYGFTQKKLDEKKINCQIATIYRDSVLINLKDYSKQLKILEAFQKQLKSEYDYKKLELDTKVLDLKDNEKTNNENQKLEKVKEIKLLEDQLNLFSKEAEQNLLKKEQELLEPLNNKINLAIESVANKYGYNQIMEQKLLYFSNKFCNITKLVIEEANK
jgi:outer membrane protein